MFHYYHHVSAFYFSKLLVRNFTQNVVEFRGILQHRILEILWRRPHIPAADSRRRSAADVYQNVPHFFQKWLLKTNVDLIL